LAFALLVSLAITTAVIRSDNIVSRIRLRRLQHDLVTHSIERARRLHEVHEATAPESLAARWRALEALSLSR